ncbi:FUT8 (predicted) [Pycnogonum litorale]
MYLLNVFKPPSVAMSPEQNLSYTIQKLFEKNQNPPDCSKAKKLVCMLYTKAGMISDIHLLLYCFHVGVMMKRTVVLDSKRWSYSINGWEDVFEPPSRTCVSYEEAVNWPGTNDSMAIKQAWLPGASPWPGANKWKLPKHLIDEIEMVASNPYAWWISQIVKYLIKPNKIVIEMVRKKIDALPRGKLTVGIQVRRTDKVAEANPTPLHVYFEKIDEFYTVRNMTDDRDRVVFLATDEVMVWKDIIELFPSYKIFGDINNSLMSNIYRTKHTLASGRQLIADMLVISKCDYIVCTLSSNICRLIYEIVMSSGIDVPDMSKHLASVNGEWHYHGTY